MKKVLNVGGNNKSFELPSEYSGWEHVLLDIDPKGAPDIVCDARELSGLPSASFDSVYCSHNLEHYYRHDVTKVLAGFLHVLALDGFVYIRVPDIGTLIKTVAEQDLDINDILYEAPAGPVTVQDIVYGFNKQVEETGNDYFAHKTGFTQKSLISCLHTAGFSWVYTDFGYLEIRAIAFRKNPSDYAAHLFNFPTAATE